MKEFILSPKSISPKVNIIGWLEFELANYNITVWHISHFVLVTFPCMYTCINICVCLYVGIFIYTHRNRCMQKNELCVYIYIYIYICVCVCVYIYIYIYIHISVFMYILLIQQNTNNSFFFILGRVNAFSIMS